MGNTPQVQKLLYKNQWKTGSVVLITGASSGLGRQLAIKYAAKGAQLMLTARNEAALKEVVEECKSAQGSQNVMFKIEYKTAEGTDWD